MSINNPREDFEKAINLAVGESFQFHMFQDMGAMIKKISENSYELYEVKWHDDVLDGTHTSETLMGAIEHVYRYWN